MESIPRPLQGRPFTRSDALEAGLSPRDLRSSRYVRVFRGVFRAAATPDTLVLRVHAARLVLPRDAALSHQTALAWRGYGGLAPEPLHFSTSRGARVERDGIVLHRREALLRPQEVRGVPILDGIRTFVDVATDVDDRELLRVGDWLVRHGHADVWDLRGFVLESHLDGVQRARRVAPYVSERVDSPRESDVRWIIIMAGLPVPVANVPILNDVGIKVAKGDLVYVDERIIVEHDGWHHERDAGQRQRDHLRREVLESLGWRLIVVTAEDFKDEPQIAWRVYKALAERGRKVQKPDIWRIKSAKSRLPEDLAN